MIDGVVVLDAVTWHSHPLGEFRARAADVVARFGPPAATDVASGIGPFAPHLVRFACGLELAVWRFDTVHRDDRDETPELAYCEVHANETERDHVAFHLGAAFAATFVTELVAGERGLVVMRTDDNGNDVVVARATSRCEAEAIVRDFETRAHKQTYWLRVK